MPQASAGNLPPGYLAQLQAEPEHMLLPPDLSFRFIEGYKAVLLRVLSNADSARTDSVVVDLVTARTHAKAEPGLISQAIKELAALGHQLEPAIVDAIQSMRVDQWVYLRHTKSFAVFLDKDARNAYEVRALTTPLYELIQQPPVFIETGLFDYAGKFVCDGLVQSPVALGRGYKQQLEAAYSAARKAGRLHRTTNRRQSHG